MTQEEAFHRAAALCARAEHCRSDIRAKLTTWEAEAPDEIIDRLVAERYIDERRYAIAFVADRLRYSHWGRIKLHYALRLKGISEDDIRTALDTIDEDEYRDILQHLIDNKNRQLQKSEPDAWRLQQKLARFATSHGFEPSLAMQMCHTDEE